MSSRPSPKKRARRGDSGSSDGDGDVDVDAARPAPADAPPLGDLAPLGDALDVVAASLSPGSRLALAGTSRTARELVRSVDERTRPLSDRAFLPGGGPVRPDSFPLPGGALVFAALDGGETVAAAGAAEDGSGEAWIALAPASTLAFGERVGLRGALGGGVPAAIAPAPGGAVRVVVARGIDAASAPGGGERALDADGENAWELWELRRRGAPAGRGRDRDREPERLLAGWGPFALSPSGEFAWVENRSGGSAGRIRAGPSASFEYDHGRYETGLLAWNARGTHLLGLFCARGESQHREAFVYDAAGSEAAARDPNGPPGPPRRGTPVGAADGWTPLRPDVHGGPVPAPPVAGGWIVAAAHPAERKGRVRFHAREDGSGAALPRAVEAALAARPHAPLGMRLLLPTDGSVGEVDAVRFGEAGSEPSIRRAAVRLPPHAHRGPCRLVWLHRGGEGAIVVRVPRHPRFSESLLLDAEDPEERGGSGPARGAPPPPAHAFAIRGLF